MSFHVETIPNRNSRPTILIRKARREDGRLRKKTIANLTELPPHVVAGVRALIRGGVTVARPEDAFAIHRAWPHGHVAAALGTLRGIGLVRLLHRIPGRMRDLAVAAIVARIVDPASKLATARALSPETASTSLGAALGLGPVTGNEMLDMLDWLLERQRHIERSLANRHLKDGTLVLFDVSSSFLEGKCCPLAAFGHSRDGKKGKKQIVYGLLCGTDGCPVAVEVFSGNTSDPQTLPAQVEKIRRRFGLEVSRVALVGDRGMITSARIRDSLRPAGMGWITALRKADVRRLIEDGGGQAAADAVAEATSDDFPGERLMVCLNPRRRKDSRRRREELLEATEAELREIADAAARGRPGNGIRLRERDSVTSVFRLKFCSKHSAFL